MIKLVWPITARSSRQGLRQDLSKGVTLCHTKGTYQIILLTSMMCFRWRGGEVMRTPQPPLATPLVDPILDA